MDYDPLGSPPRGEVLVKGGTVTQGYYKDQVRGSSGKLLGEFCQ